MLSSVKVSSSVSTLARPVRPKSRNAMRVKQVIAKASNAKDIQFVMDDDNSFGLAPGIAAALCAASYYGQWTCTYSTLRTTLAVAALAFPLASAVTNKWRFDKVGSGLAPAALAAEMLAVLPILPAAIAAFGTMLCQQLDSMLDVKYGFYGALATMAFAICNGYASIWFCCAYGLVAGICLQRGYQSKQVPILATLAGVATIGASVLYFLNKTDYTEMVTMCVVVAHTAWAMFQGGRKVANDLSE